jgi:hypothetical protein
MRTTIKLSLLAAVGIPLLAAPALANTSHHHVPGAVQYNLARGASQNETVFEAGRYLGRDPDPNIRFELHRDAAAYEGND